ncbi:hypothetical protein ACI1US_00396 [Leucobacter sp. BZR 635]
MAFGLTPAQEILEIDLGSMTNTKMLIDEALAAKPEHRIIALSIMSWGEFSSWGKAVVVIEFVASGNVESAYPNS